MYKKIVWALTTFLFLSVTQFSSAAEPICQSSDWSHLWPSQKAMNQGGIGSCQIFATTSLVNARYFQDTGKNRELSEADFFKQWYLLQSSQEKHLQTIFSKKDAEGKYQPDVATVNAILEGGLFLEEFEFLKKYGVCTSNTADEFIPYNDILNIFEEHHKKCSEAIGYISGANMTYEYLPEECKLTFKEEIKSEVKSILDSDKFEASLLSLTSQKCIEERQNTKDIIQNYRPISLFILNNPSDLTIKLKKEIIKEWLSCGPLNVTVWNPRSILNGKHDETMDVKGATAHAIILAGYSCEENKFLIKNSWGEFINKVDEEIFLQNLVAAFFLESSKNLCSSANLWKRKKLEQISQGAWHTIFSPDILNHDLLPSFFHFLFDDLNLDDNLSSSLAMISFDYMRKSQYADKHLGELLFFALLDGKKGNIAQPSIMVKLFKLISYPDLYNFLSNLMKHNISNLSIEAREKLFELIIDHLDLYYMLFFNPSGKVPVTDFLSSKKCEEICK